MRQTVALHDWQAAQGRQRDDRDNILQAREEIVSALRGVKRGPNVGEENLGKILSGIIKAAEILGSSLLPREVFDDLQQGNAMRYLKALMARGCFGEKTSYSDERGCRFSKLHLVVNELPEAGEGKPPNGSKHATQKLVRTKSTQPSTEKPTNIQESPNVVPSSVPQIVFPARLAHEIADLVAQKLNGKAAELRPATANAERRERAPIPVIAFIDWPNHQVWRKSEANGETSKFVAELNPLALRGLLARPGEYLKEGRLYMKTPPRRYTSLTVRSWKFDVEVRASGFNPFYEYDGKDIDHLMRRDIAEAQFLTEMQPGSKCSIVIGSGDGGYIPFIRQMRQIAERLGVECHVRLLARREKISGSFNGLVDQTVMVNNLPIYTYFNQT